MRPPGCSKDNFKDCSNRNDCEWIVGKGCRSNKHKLYLDNIFIPLTDQNDTNFKFKHNNKIYNDIPMDINIIPRMYLVIFADCLGISHRSKKIHELRQLLKHKIVFEKNPLFIYIPLKHQYDDKFTFKHNNKTYSDIPMNIQKIPRSLLDILAQRLAFDTQNKKITEIRKFIKPRIFFDF